MNYSNKKFYFQWLGIGFVITFLCVGMGIYVTKILAKREIKNREEVMMAKREGKVNRPFRQRVEIMQKLINEHQITPEEAFKIVDKTHEAPFPEAAFLLDKDGKVISSHATPGFDREEADDYKEIKLCHGRYLRVYFDDDDVKKHRRFMKHAPPHMPREFYIISGITISVSIILGIGLSLIILTIYMRRKAKKAEEVMNKIKAGELHTRFPITQADEGGQLMLKFNEMAGEIEGLVKNLKATEEARTKLLQELAHDLRTPVASMKSIQEILFNQGDQLETQEKKHLQTLAMREVTYFERLVEDLLFLSGVNDPRYTQQMTEVNLTSLIREELEVFDVGQKRMTINADENLRIKGDVHLLHRLLKNALSNALRHAKSTVHVELHQKDGQIKLQVRDDGKGFKEEDFKTFGEKKYSRALQDDSETHISVGLGSVIMKKIMSLHNGTLTIRNTAEGAEISFSFPE